MSGLIRTIQWLGCPRCQKKNPGYFRTFPSPSFSKIILILRNYRLRFTLKATHWRCTHLWVPAGVFNCLSIPMMTLTIWLLDAFVLGPPPLRPFQWRGCPFSDFLFLGQDLCPCPFSLQLWQVTLVQSYLPTFLLNFFLRSRLPNSIGTTYYVGCVANVLLALGYAFLFT